VPTKLKLNGYALASIVLGACCFIAALSLNSGRSWIWVGVEHLGRGVFVAILILNVIAIISGYIGLRQAGGTSLQTGRSATWRRLSEGGLLISYLSLFLYIALLIFFLFFFNIPDMSGL
jgi:hypothetical protein